MNKKELKKWKKLALDFHNAYERLAPKFGYQTRKDTREFDPKSANGQLMTAVVRVVMQKQITKAKEEAYKEVIENIKCGYPKALTITEHNNNIAVIDNAVLEIKQYLNAKYLKV